MMPHKLRRGPLMRLMILATMVVAWNVQAAPAPPAEPYSCQMFREAQRKCAANSFGPCYVQRDMDRLRQQCVREGGNP
jgi:hypothetical protein